MRPPAPRRRDECIPYQDPRDRLDGRQPHGIFLLPQNPVLVLLGNIAFPLFAWLIANGVRHSRDLRQYALRLFAFACISQVPFWLANTLIGSAPLYLNVFFTLALGLLAILAIRGTPKRFLWVLAVAGCAAAAQAVNADYGAAGVFSIVASYLLFDRLVPLALALAAILVVLPLGLPYAQRYAPGANLDSRPPRRSVRTRCGAGRHRAVQRERGAQL